MRGLLDFIAVLHKIRRRSIYGVAQHPFQKKHVKRDVRKYL